MAIEKELKLALGDVAPDTVAQYLSSLPGVTAPRTFPLVNIYFDTPARDLARRKIALRLRLAPEGWLQTLKTAGKSVDGLHARGEWEMPVADARLDLDALRAACDDAEALAALEGFVAAGVPLVPLFRTDFTRTVWLVDTAGAQIELALDNGHVCIGDGEKQGISEGTGAGSAGDASAAGETGASGATAHVAEGGRSNDTLPIRELEMELKSGDEGPLRQFADTVRAALPGLHADDTSKAARGYALYAQSQEARA